jgi:hypothetical protein
MLGEFALGKTDDRTGMVKQDRSGTGRSLIEREYHTHRRLGAVDKGTAGRVLP